MKRENYSNPLVERYASREMNFIFSPQFKFSTWRKLWLVLAKAQKEQGLNISDEQIQELEENIDSIDFDKASEYEKNFRHDVMAHVHTLADKCPKAAPIIHLGVTSAFVGDNTDLIQIKEALGIILNKILNIIKLLRAFALEHKDLPTLGWTHFQPAQLTTVGKRACLWMQELLLDVEEIKWLLETLPFRGVKGTTGTQASFMKLFNGNGVKIDAINKQVRENFGFTRDLKITGQTYSRKIDNRISHVLDSIAQSAAKFSTDLRLLANKKEMEEPFEKSQIGSSAMAYKRNPMRAERIGSLARYVSSLTHATAFTAATQWLERTLDDSANKRLAIPQGFLAVDAILDIYSNVVNGLVVYPKIIEKNIREELPFIATENVMMLAVQKGANRQEVHETIRKLSLQAAENIKMHGKENNLIELMINEPSLNINEVELKQSLRPENYIGRSAEMVVDFIKTEVDKHLKNYQEISCNEPKV